MSPSQPAGLVGRRPEVPAAALVGALAPPPHFHDATLDNYSPDPDFPSQAAAREAVERLASEASARRRPETGRGLYLDGGFGVGKTHLLAGLAHRLGGAAAFGSFVEYTALVGALGFAAARDALAGFRAVCIDEFELDDPGDTLILARLMRELTDRGVLVAATSNTLPGSLGQGRFAADDFRREIQSLAALFEVVGVDGPDYRHRGEVSFPAPASEEDVRAAGLLPGAALDEWPELVVDLAHVHPSRFGAYVEGVTVACWLEVGPLADQSHALRVVALVDRLYDRDVRVVASGASLGQVFPEEMLRGGYRKKYLRALSRLAAMAQAPL